MNFLQLVQRLIVEAGASGVTIATTSSQTGEVARMVNFVNAAWMDVQQMHQDWQWLRGNVTFPTVTSQATYTPTQCGLTDFGMWQRDSFRNYANPTVTLTIATPCVVTLASHGLSVGDTVKFYTSGALPTGITSGTTYYVLTVPSSDTFTFSTSAGGSAVNTSGTQSGTHTITSNNTTIFAGLRSEIFMDYVSYEDWRNSYQYGALRSTTSRPIAITITPDKSLGLGPIPIEGYTVVGSYYKVPSEMSSDSDTPTLPSQYHMAIVYRALMMYGMQEGASDAVQRGEYEFNRIMRRVAIDRLPDFRMSGALC